MLVPFLVFVSACTAASGDQARLVASGQDTLLLQTRCAQIDASRRCTLWGPALLELIARPELYDGRRVRVIGFVNFEFEGNGLYVSSEDWRRNIYRNGVWVDPPDRFKTDSAPSQTHPNQRYVLLEGTFSARRTGHLGMWSGSIEKVTRLEQWGEPPRPLERR
jgi:hypothetical protein